MLNVFWTYRSRDTFIIHFFSKNFQIYQSYFELPIREKFSLEKLLVKDVRKKNHYFLLKSEIINFELFCKSSESKRIAPEFMTVNGKAGTGKNWLQFARLTDARLPKLNLPLWLSMIKLLMLPEMRLRKMSKNHFLSKFRNLRGFYNQQNTH